MPSAGVPWLCAFLIELLDAFNFARQEANEFEILETETARHHHQGVGVGGAGAMQSSHDRARCAGRRISAPHGSSALARSRPKISCSSARPDLETEPA